MKKLSGLSALVSPRVVLGVGLISVTALFGGTGCGLSYSLTGIYVEPTAGHTCVPNGGTAQYNAYGTYTEGGHSMKIQDITSQVSWSVTTPQLATITSSGLLTANDGVMTNGNLVVYTGTSSVIATTQGEFGNLTSASDIQVSSNCGSSSSAVVQPFSLNIVPQNQALAVGQTLQPLAIATYAADGHNADLSRQVSWSSSNPGVATVDSHGVISSLAAGEATITAQARTASGETVIGTQTLHLQGNSQQQ